MYSGENIGVGVWGNKWQGKGEAHKDKPDKQNKKAERLETSNPKLLFVKYFICK